MVSDIPAGDGDVANLFYGVLEKEVGIATKYIGKVRKGKKRRLNWLGEKKR